MTLDDLLTFEHENHLLFWAQTQLRIDLIAQLAIYYLEKNK